MSQSSLELIPPFFQGYNLSPDLLSFLISPGSQQTFPMADPQGLNSTFTPKASFPCPKRAFPRQAASCPRLTGELRSSVLSSHPAPGQPRSPLPACGGQEKEPQWGSFRVKAKRAGSEEPAGITYGRKHARSPEGKRLRSCTGDLLPEWELRMASREGGNLYPKILFGSKPSVERKSHPRLLKSRDLCDGLKTALDALLRCRRHRGWQALKI